MSLLDHLLRQEMRRRMYGRRTRRAPWYPPPPRRGRRYGMWGAPGRSYYAGRRRSQVRVGGCCLPIPLGALTAAALALRLVAGRHRR